MHPCRLPDDAEGSPDAGVVRVLLRRLSVLPGECGARVVGVLVRWGGIEELQRRSRIISPWESVGFPWRSGTGRTSVSP
jgi:hypothetical protein